MAAPLASIVITNHNYARFLRDAIDSALAQTYANVEVIVVDDGSTDGSRDLLRSYSERARVLLQDNEGQDSAINAAFEHLRGEVACFLDADDGLFPTAIERAVAAFDDDTSKVHWPLAL